MVPLELIGRVARRAAARRRCSCYRFVARRRRRPVRAAVRHQRDPPHRRPATASASPRTGRSGARCERGWPAIVRDGIGDGELRDGRRPAHRAHDHVERRGRAELVPPRVEPARPRRRSARRWPTSSVGGLLADRRPGRSATVARRGFDIASKRRVAFSTPKRADNARPRRSIDGPIPSLGAESGGDLRARSSLAYRSDPPTCSTWWRRRAARTRRRRGVRPRLVAAAASAPAATTASPTAAATTAARRRRASGEHDR